MYNDGLKHYRVLGQKLGVRKAKDNLAKAWSRRTKIDDESKEPVSNPSSFGKKSKIIVKGQNVVTSMLNDIFYNGYGKKNIARIGKNAVTACLKKSGHTNIKWDN